MLFILLIMTKMCLIFYVNTFKISCVSHVPICIIGDFNSRTGTLNDFLCFEDCISKETGIDMIGSDVFLDRILML